MEHIASLIETLLWVGMIVWIVSKFGKSIANILDALHNRVASGGAVKAGPFELGESLKPQAIEDQKEKVESEVNELIGSQSQSTTKLVDRKAAMAQYFEAEDLALRAIQSEFDAKVSRQVTAGADMGFDGAFVKDGTLHIIEVKTISRLRSEMFQRFVHQVSSAVSRYGWKNVRIILVAVSDLDPEKIREIAMRSLEGSAYPVELRIYGLAKLREQFGLEHRNG